MSSAKQNTTVDSMDGNELEHPAPKSGTRDFSPSIKDPVPQRLSDMGRKAPSNSNNRGEIDLSGLTLRSQPSADVNGTRPATNSTSKRRYRSFSLFNDTSKNTTPKHRRLAQATAARGNIRDYADVPYLKKPLLTNDAHPLMTTGPLFRPRTRTSDSNTKIIAGAALSSG